MNKKALQISIRLDIDTMEDIRKLSYKNNRSLNGEINYIILRYLDEMRLEKTSPSNYKCSFVGI